LFRDYDNQNLPSILLTLVDHVDHSLIRESVTKRPGVAVRPYNSVFAVNRYGKRPRTISDSKAAESLLRGQSELANIQIFALSQIIYGCARA